MDLPPNTLPEGNSAPVAAPPEVRTAPRWLVSAGGVAWRVGLLLVVAYFAVLALAQLRVVVLPVVVALMLTTVLSPPTRWLERRGLRSGLAAAIVFLLGLLAFVGLVVFIA